MIHVDDRLWQHRILFVFIQTVSLAVIQKLSTSYGHISFLAPNVVACERATGKDIIRAKVYRTLAYVVVL